MLAEVIREVNSTLDPERVADAIVARAAQWLPAPSWVVYAVDNAGQLLSYGDSATPGNVSDPAVVGFGGWADFKFLFGGRDQTGQDRIYAVVPGV